MSLFLAMFWIRINLIETRIEILIIAKVFYTNKSVFVLIKNVTFFHIGIMQWWMPIAQTQGEVSSPWEGIQKISLFRGPFVRFRTNWIRIQSAPMHPLFMRFIQFSDLQSNFFLWSNLQKFINLITGNYYFRVFQTYFNQNALTLIRSLITGGATPELGNFFKGSTSRDY